MRTRNDRTPLPRRAPRRLLSAAAIATTLAGGAVTGCAKDSGAGGTNPTNAAGATPTSAPPTSAGPATSGPSTSAWAGAPNPCSLLVDSEIRAITHFDVNTERLDSKGPAGETLPNCVSSNRTAQTQGGYVTVTLFPPGSPLLDDRTPYTNIADVPGLGTSAIVAHNSRAKGAGTNVALVNMGNGGFLISAQVFSDVSSAEMQGLATAAASRWPKP